MNKTGAQMPGTARVRRAPRGGRRLSIACAAAALALLVVPGAAQAGTLDQQQTSFTGSANFGGDFLLAQTFTPGLDGQLDQVDLRLADNGSPGALTVEIQEVSGGVPSGTVLASSSILEADIPTSFDWVSVPLSPPAPSVAGTQYAIVLSTPVCCYALQSSADNPYAAGAQHTSLDGGVTWSPTSVGQVDMAFKTYVLPQEDPALYAFTGFFSPVDNLPVLNMAKAGTSIAVKFSLGGDQGLGVLAVGSPVSYRIACDTSDPVDAIEDTTTSNSGLSYDPFTDRYTYVWKTARSWAGQCRQLSVRLDDDSDHQANFRFR